MLHILLLWTLLLDLLVGRRYLLFGSSSSDFSDDELKLYLLAGEVGWKASGF